MKIDENESTKPILNKENDNSLIAKSNKDHILVPELLSENKPDNIDKKKEVSLSKEKTKLSLRDGIKTVIGEQLYNIGLGCFMVIFNLTTYLMSYLRHYQEVKTITLQYSYFIGPVFSITMGLFIPTVGIFENKLGLKLSIILGCILILWSSIILYFSKNYYMDLSGFFINSFGLSMNTLLSRNTMRYFYHIRGKLSGILSVINSLVSSGYNIIGEKWIVNPNSEEATIDKSYYTFSVCRNLLKLLRISWIFLIIGVILSVILVVPYDPKKHVKLFAPIKKDKNQEKEEIGPLVPEDDKNKKIDNGDNKKNENIKNVDVMDKEKEIKGEERDKVNPKNNKDLIKNKNDFSKTSSCPEITNKEKILYNTIINKSSEKTEEYENIAKKNRSNSISYKAESLKKISLNKIILDNEIAAVKSPPPVKKKLKFNFKLIKKALKSRRLLFLFLMGIFSTPFTNFLSNSWRPMGIRKGVPTKYLQDIGTYRPFITCASALIFSTLSDYCPFRYLYAIFSLLSTVVAFTFCFSFSKPGLFTFIILLNNVASTGKTSITTPHYMKVFGLKYYIEIGGVLELSRVFMSPLCTVFIFLFETYIGAPEGEQINDIPYIILFIITGLFNVIAAILSLFEPEEEYNLQ